MLVLMCAFRGWQVARGRVRDGRPRDGRDDTAAVPWRLRGGLRGGEVCGGWGG